jgi:hypothetical protein
LSLWSRKEGRESLYLQAHEYYRRSEANHQGKAWEQFRYPEDGQHSDSPTEHDVPFRIHNEVSDPENDLLFGVQDSEGDGTVPLMSLGYMCVEGWKRADLPYNPAGIKVTTREYPHQPSSLFSDLRGGPDTADHVDIMGNYGMTVDILHIVSNRGHKVQERVVSPIKEYVRGVDLKLDLSSE